MSKIKIEPKVVYAAALGFVIGNVYGTGSTIRIFKRNIKNK